MRSAKGLSSGNFEEHQPRGAHFALGCQNPPWFHWAATHWLSLALITTVLIRAVDGFHEQIFSQNSRSFWSLSLGKLEAALTSQLKRKQEETSNLVPPPPAGFPLSPQTWSVQARKTTDHREAPWASEEEREERERSQAAFTLSHIITHHRGSNSCPFLYFVPVPKMFATICSFK